jgi:signal transduction histidine kinase
MKKLHELLRYVRQDFGIKVFLSIFFSGFVFWVLQNFLYITFEEKSLVQELQQDGVLLAEVLAQNARLGVFAEREELLEAPVAAVMAQHEVLEACVFTMDGTLLKRAGASPGETGAGDDACGGVKRESAGERIQASPAPFFVERPGDFQFCAPVTRSGLFTRETFMYFQAGEGEEVRNGKAAIGVACVTLDKGLLKKRLHEIVRRSLIVAVLLLLVGCLVTYFIVRGVTRPLKRLAQEVRARGSEIGDSDDIDLLAGTFESLLKNLGRAFQTIAGLKAGLEERVEERTRELAEANRLLAERQSVLEEANRRLEEVLGRLKETQGQLIQSEKMAGLGQLVAGVAHEINNTTNFISAALPPLKRIIKSIRAVLEHYEAVSAEAGPDAVAQGLAEVNTFKASIQCDKRLEDLDTLLANISQGAERTAKIVMDLKMFSRAEGEESREVDIHKNLESALTLISHEYRYGVEVVRNYAPGLPPVRCFAGQLNQVFMNILLNAAQAVQGSGRVFIRTWAEAGMVHIAIRDTGVGISEEVLARIFDPFFTTKDVGAGTGLGLSISYGIIKRHQGEISVKSEVGKGAEFVIAIPIAGPK